MGQFDKNTALQALYVCQGRGRGGGRVGGRNEVNMLSVRWDVECKRSKRGTDKTTLCIGTVSRSHIPDHLLFQEGDEGFAMIVEKSRRMMYV
jgi:hypothetical protein